MKFRSLFKNRGLGMNLLASSCFLLLAVFGWGLAWSELGQYLLILLILLGGLIGSAAVVGWLLRQFIKWRNRNHDQF